VNQLEETHKWHLALTASNELCIDLSGEAFVSNAPLRIALVRIAHDPMHKLSSKSIELKDILFIKNGICFLKVLPTGSKYSYAETRCVRFAANFSGHGYRLNSIHEKFVVDEPS